MRLELQYPRESALTLHTVEGALVQDPSPQESLLFQLLCALVWVALDGPRESGGSGRQWVRLPVG